ncbi:DUF1127 domain-containing protein [Roseobacter sp.]|uniref:DUF1127 domain-containing protein n=1 Tax=Roseobacter sp. TaxID=1907202 RepID=UPI00385DFDB4
MAYYTETKYSSASLIERALLQSASLLQDTSARYARYRVFRQTYSELAQLTDRDLADLGISRSMIRSLAMEAAENYSGK